MKRMDIALATVFTLTAITAAAHAQGLTFSPSKGQSAELQTKDQTECGALAVQQSGFDPARAQAAAAQPQPAPEANR